MTAHSVTVELPEVLFRKIERAAKGLNQPMPQALLKIVESGLPSLDRVPAGHRSELEAMETWSDQQLWRVAREALPADQQQDLSELLGKNQQGELSATQEARLDALHGQTNRLLLRKSYALALLKWRGNKMPAFGPTTTIN